MPALLVFQRATLPAIKEVLEADKAFAHYDANGKLISIEIPAAVDFVRIDFGKAKEVPLAKPIDKLYVP